MWDPQRILPEPPPPDFDTLPPGVRLDLDERFQRVPFDRIRHWADYWALRSIEAEHIAKLARRFALTLAQQESVEHWWQNELYDRLKETLNDLQERSMLVYRRLLSKHRRLRRSQVLFQVWFNSLGPGGRTWFGNRYTTIRHYTFRIHWRP